MARRPVDDAPPTTTALNLVRAELCQVTAAYFAGAPVYDRMHALENKLFEMMYPSFRPRAGRGFHVGPQPGITFHDQ